MIATLVFWSLVTPARAEGNPAWADQQPVAIAAAIDQLRADPNENWAGLVTAMNVLASQTERLPVRRAWRFWVSTAGERIDELADVFVQSRGYEGGEHRALQTVILAYLVAAGAQDGPKFLWEGRLLATAGVIFSGTNLALYDPTVHPSQALLTVTASVVGLVPGLMIFLNEQTNRFDRQFKAPEYAPREKTAALISRFWTRIEARSGARREDIKTDATTAGEVCRGLLGVVATRRY